MSAVCVLTPIVVASWPALASAIAGAAASMGFSVGASAGSGPAPPRRRSVETEIENSEVIDGALTQGERIVVERDGVTLEFSQDDRGGCKVCVSGEGPSERKLRQIGEEAAGRVVQQFAYHKLMSELKARNWHLVGEEVLADQSVRVRLRL